MPCICIYFGIVAIHLYIHKNMFCVVYVPTVLRFFFHFFQSLFLPVTHVASRLCFYFYKEHERLNVKV